VNAASEANDVIPAQGCLYALVELDVAEASVGEYRYNDIVGQMPLDRAEQFIFLLVTMLLHR